MRLIDADALWEKVGKIEIPSNHTMIAYKLIKAFDEAPTIEAEKVIYCRECENFDSFTGFCCVRGENMGKCDFCSCAIAKQSEGSER